MFTPCWPSAGPTGGAGVALPAGICNLTCPITFFAIYSSRCALPKLRFLNLKKVEFDRSRPAEYRHHDLQCVSVCVHIIDHAVEARKGTVNDLDRLTLFE